MKTGLKSIDGVVIGIFLGFGVNGRALVVFAENPDDTAIPAKTLAALTTDMIGSEVALLFEGSDARKPLIVGRLVAPRRQVTVPEVISDGKPVRIVGEERIELRCGKATIIMEKDGRITIRGTYVTSHASVKNRIRGGSVNLN